MALAFDNFNGGDGGLGANWTTISGRSAPQIVSQEVQDLAVGAPSAEALYTAITWPDNQYAQCVVRQAAASAASVGVYVRGLTVSRTGYILQVLGPIGATAVYTLLRINAGSATTLISSTTITLAVNDVLYCDIVGFVLTGKLNGTPLFTFDDSGDGNKLSSGSAGITISVSSGSITDAILDDFEGGNTSTTITGLGRRLQGFIYSQGG